MPRGYRKDGQPHKIRRVALLGFGDPGDFDPHESKRHSAWECWGANYAPRWTEERGVKWSRFYQLHPWETADPYEIAWAKWCRKNHIPVYVFWPHHTQWKQHATAWVTKAYPYTNIRSTFLWKGRGRRHVHDGFFASSWSYMVAHALYERVAEIGLFGVRLHEGSPRERLVEYPALLWWLGVAHGQGVQVTIQQGSDLMAYPHLYGRDYIEEVEWVRKRVRHLSLREDETIDGADSLPDALAQVTP